MINLIRQATSIANLFRIKQSKSSSRGFLVFWVAYNEILIGSLS
jgi:hypothetical protein